MPTAYYNYDLPHLRGPYVYMVLHRSNYLSTGCKLQNFFIALHLSYIELVGVIAICICVRPKP